MAGESPDTEKPFEDETEPNATLATPAGERVCAHLLSGYCGGAFKFGDAHTAWRQQSAMLHESPMGLIRQSKYLFRLKEAADRVESERD